jgi:hypothetical protein
MKFLQVIRDLSIIVACTIFTAITTLSLDIMLQLANVQ